MVNHQKPLLNAKRFPAGTIEFQVSLEKGQVKEATIYGDFFGTEDVAELAGKIIGCRFEREEVEKAWSAIDTKAYFGGIEKEAILAMLFE